MSPPHHLLNPLNIALPHHSSCTTAPFTQMGHVQWVVVPTKCNRGIITATKHCGSGMLTPLPTAFAAKGNGLGRQKCDSAVCGFSAPQLANVNKFSWGFALWRSGKVFFFLKSVCLYFLNFRGAIYTFSHHTGSNMFC